MESPQLLRLARSVARGELPETRSDSASDVDQTPADGRRHGWPVRPQPILYCAVQVEEEKGNDIRHSGLCYRALSPRLEGSRSSSVLGCAFFGSIRVVGKLRDRDDFAVEVVLEGFLEGGHYAQ